MRIEQPPSAFFWFTAAGLFLASFLFAGTAIQFLSSSILGTNLGQPWFSHEFDFLVGLAGALVLTAVILCLPISERERVALTAIWLAKSALALGPMLIYEAHYDLLDAYIYHEDARVGLYGVEDLGWGKGTENVTLILQVLYGILPPAYHLAKVVFAFIGLLGVYLTYKGGAKFWGGHSLVPLFVLSIFPGILFWSSILGKDPLVIFGIGLYVYGLGSMAGGRSSRGLAVLLLGICIASAIRIWMAPILALPLLLLIVLSHRLNGLVKAGLVIVSLIVGSVLLFVAIERLTDSGEVTIVERVDALSEAWAEGGSSLEVPDFDSYPDMLKFAPLGAFTALFRPLPGEIGSFFGIVASIENFLLLCLVLVAAFRTRLSSLRDPLLVTLLVVISVWAVVYGFVSYQNLGTAVRFKAQVLPIILLVVMYPWWNRGRPRTRVIGVISGARP